MATGDLGALDHDLGALEDLLRNDDFDSQQKLDTILTAVQGTALEEGFRRVASAVSSYDFEAALAELGRIRRA